MAANQQEPEIFRPDDDEELRAEVVFNVLMEVIRQNARYQANYAALFQKGS